MKPFASILCMICATALLGACSYFDTGEGPDVSSGGQTIDLMNGGPAQRLETGDLVNITNGASDGSVTVYSLDGPPGAAPGLSDHAAQPVQPVSALRPVGAVHAYDPSVEVYPLDDAMSGLVSPQTASATVSGPLKAAPYDAQPLLPEDGSYTSRAGEASPGGPVSVFFGHDSEELGPDAAAKVAAVSRGYRKGEGISVEGHASIRANYADEVQKRVVNLRVSMKRALAVASKLIAGGVPADSIQTVAWGDTKPAPSVPGMDTEAVSRRVDIFTQSLQ